MRARAGVLVPVLLIGRAALDGKPDEHALAFLLARQLADLRTDRIARLLCPRAGELAQIIELASAVPGDTASHAARWLTTSLHPVELAQAQAIGTRIRERRDPPDDRGRQLARRHRACGGSHRLRRGRRPPDVRPRARARARADQRGQPGPRAGLVERDRGAARRARPHRGLAGAARPGGSAPAPTADDCLRGR